MQKRIFGVHTTVAFKIWLAIIEAPIICVISLLFTNRDKNCLFFLVLSEILLRWSVDLWSWCCIIISLYNPCCQPCNCFLCKSLFKDKKGWWYWSFSGVNCGLNPYCSGKIFFFLYKLQYFIMSMLPFTKNSLYFSVPSLYSNPL